MKIANPTNRVSFGRRRYLAYPRGALISASALVFATFAFAVTPAFAETAAPGWQLFGRTSPTNLPPGGEGVLRVAAFNLGAGDSDEGPTVTDTLPAGLTAGEAYVYQPEDIDQALGKCSGAGTKTVTCKLVTLDESVRRGEVHYKSLEILIPVTVAAGLSGGAMDTATVTGGGELHNASTSFPVLYGSGVPSAGFAGIDAWLTNADGTIDTQAGSHPYDLTIVSAFNNYLTGTVHTNDTEFGAGGEVRNLNVNLPPGLVGNPQATPQCTRRQFDGLEFSGGDIEGVCPLSSQVGVNFSDVNGITTEQAVYNIVPPSGVAAEFGFQVLGIKTFLDSGVRSGSDNGVTSHIDNIVQRNLVYDYTIIWGSPAEASHNNQRSGITATGESCEDGSLTHYLGCPADVPVKPLLTLPTSCQGQPEFSAEYLGTWQDENDVAPSVSIKMHNSEGNPVGFTGCERLQPFKPEIAISPDTAYADTPAGLSVEVKTPQGLNPEGLQTPNLEDTTVTLPEGIVVNPGQGNGLVACQPSEEALGLLPDGEANEGPPSCPAASKVGTDEISTPLLPNKLQGNVYVLGQDPPNLQLLMTASGEGVNLKLVGNIHLNEANGQLTTTFDNTPDFPFTDFKLAFSGGAQAALATPTGCGTYEADTTFTPWSSPFIEDAFDTSRFQITSGPGGSACPVPLPFSPTLTAGATTDEAGGYTNFSLLLQRGDEQQRIAGLQFKAPAGLTGFISKVPLCTNAQAETNTCPEASKIGHTVVESGPGPYPLVVPEAGQPPAPIYLTESYEGAPFGLSIVVPIKAGPFTLPTQRVRARIEVDPVTSALTITTGELPQEVAGIPTDLREVDAVIERPEFMVNPTNCDPQSFSGAAYGTPPPGQDTPGTSAAISSHFQVGACQALKFEPKFSVSASGHNSRVDGASLTARVSYPSVPQGTDADIGSVKIELPKQLSSRLSTLQKACTSAQFEANPAGCPTASRIGYATVHTPLLPVALTGPAIFVSHGGEAFPTLTMVLQGDGVTVDIVGTTFISKAGITSTTFKTVPDDPFSTFELTLGQGPYSALTANVPNSSNYSLCGETLRMPTEFTGQNGAVIKQSTPITPTGCTKTKTKTKTLTRAQKLTKALQNCHKSKKHKRAKCEKAARKHYGPPSKKTKKR